MQTDNRNLNLDLIRFVAIVLVMFVHSQRFLDASIQEAGPGSIGSWVKLLLFPVGACNALFVMVSGALLLRRVDGVCDFFRRRLVRILVPFVIWASAAFLISQWRGGGAWGWNTLLLYVQQMLTSGTNTAHWFVYMILGLYLFTPLLQRFVNRAEESVVLLTVLVLGCLSCKGVLMKNTTFEMLRSPDCVYFFAFLTGYYASHYWQMKRNFLPLQWAGLVVTFLLCVADSLWTLNGFPSELYLAVFVFGLLLKVPLSEDTLWCRFYSLVSRNSYGIYLSHIMFIPVLFPLMPYIPAWLTPFVLVLLTLGVEAAFFRLLERLRLTRFLT